MRYTLGKEEKLKSKKLIEQLFAEGSRIKSFPIQLIYLQSTYDAEFPIKVGFSVPKRSIKLAVNRNRIKRVLREVYRKNKYLFSENIHKQYIFMFIYMAKDEIEYADLELSFKKLNEKFLSKIKEDETKN
ncbi:ribonuclease P protein component [Lutibacter sp. B1]|jgi:ribonuclease P protein component|uniref:ribonuclease P protein component n=1 Tax=Lutibacter sp. B1 TaxID=2725996 RepID=UPI001456F4DC|nr:ribonuclease P protein component [Lutibacter sp. B1]NLP57045.1 ribonuclease P protein component [Lutibacter sp. B1]